MSKLKSLDNYIVSTKRFKWNILDDPEEKSHYILILFVTIMCQMNGTNLSKYEIWVKSPESHRLVVVVVQRDKNKNEMDKSYIDNSKYV